MNISVFPKENAESKPRVEISLVNSKHHTTETTLINVESFERIYDITDENGIPWSVDLHADERMRRIGREFQFHSDTDEEPYQSYIGKRCTIERMLTKEEADILASILMWKARFEDGTVLDVFDNELILPLERKWDLINHPDRINPKPIEPLTNRIQNAQHISIQQSNRKPVNQTQFAK